MLTFTIHRPSVRRRVNPARSEVWSSRSPRAGEAAGSNPAELIIPSHYLNRSYAMQPYNPDQYNEGEQFF